jgi:hypothetical protein
VTPGFDRRKDDHFVLDKKIPVAMILTMLLQCGVGIWWVSALNSRVNELERGADKTLVKSTNDGNEMSAVKERVLKLEINLTNINTKLDEIKDLLRKK